jgi:uncharacterized protein GlcG (DUF336 family)
LLLLSEDTFNPFHRAQIGFVFLHVPVSAMRLKKTPQPSSSDAENAWLKHVPNVVAVGGGVPIKAGTETIGGVGVSGAPGTEKDDACAKAEIAKVADSLK